jgi:signal transduction histidine kinase
MEEAAEELTRARDSVGTMLGKIRDLSHVMYPRILDTLGIVGAIKELVHQSSSRSGIEIECTSVGAETTLPESTAFCIYRCCQEALNNALRHSEAARIQIEVSFDPGSVRLNVADSGKGFDPRALLARGSQVTDSGFWTIRQRVADLSGSFRVSTAHRQGTVVEIIIPYDVRKPDGRRKNKTIGRG